MLDAIYHRSPHAVKQILLGLRAKSNYRKRFTPDFYRYLDEYKRLWTASEETYLSFQNHQLARTLTECFDYVPHYRQLFQDLNVRRDQLADTPLATLRELPLLDKQVRVTQLDQLISSNPERPTKTIGHTSGTSGSPSKNYLDSESVARGFALWARFHHTIGLTERERSVRFSGRLIVRPTRTKPPFWVLNKIENQLFMSSYHLTEANLPHYLEKLDAFRPTFLDGYPSALFVVAKFINSSGHSIGFTPKAIAVTAETLHEYQRTEIEKAFGCSVFNQYASSEGSPFITECREGNLHQNADSGIFEFLNSDNQPARPGEIGRMVVTSLRNFKTPLIRYDIGDVVIVSKESGNCQCGCRMPIVHSIVGREDDLLWTEEKGYVGRMDTAYKGLEGLLRSQILQHNPSDFTVNNEVDMRFTERTEQKLEKNLKDRLGQNISIKINRVDCIPLGPSGKFDAVKRLFEVETTGR